MSARQTETPRRALLSGGAAAIAVAGSGAAAPQYPAVEAALLQTAATCEHLHDQAMAWEDAVAVHEVPLGDENSRREAQRAWFTDEMDELAFNVLGAPVSSIEGCRAKARILRCLLERLGKDQLEDLETQLTLDVLRDLLDAPAVRQ